mgnify:CR=1 FL=1
MYNDVMHRTQIYLSDDELRLLDQAERTTGASRSELIRRAVHETFGRSSGEERLAALRRGKGLWSRRQETGSQFVDARRGDLGDRLERLGLG